MKIYVADTYNNFRFLLADALRHDGADVAEFRDGASLLGAAVSVPPALVVMDWRLADVSALDVLEHLRAEGILAPVIVTTSDAPEDVPIEARHGRVRVLRKPFRLEELRALVATLMRVG